MHAISQQTFLHWFGPPQLPQADLRHRARALWMVSWPFFAVVTTVLGFAVLVEPHTLARRAVTIAAVGALVVGMHIISRASRPVLASWILVLGLSVLVTQRAWITGGIDAPVAVFYGLFIVMAAALIGARGAFVTAAVCLLGGVVLAIGTVFHWATARPGAGLPLAGFFFVVLAIGLALVIQALVTLRPERERGSNAVQLFVDDMRTPTWVLLGHLELLRENVRGDIAKDVDRAIDSAAALDRVANNFHDLAQLEAGRMPVRRSVTNLAELVGAIVSTIRDLQPACELVVETHGDCSCNCDPQLTGRIVENLVNNAITHTKIDGQVRVVVSGSADRVHVAIHDVFGSSGLELAFCRVAVEAQGGTIRVEDAAPRGAVFVVELPR